MDLPDLVALIGGQLITPAQAHDGRCPVCGAGTDSRVNGEGIRLCRPCTEAEVGESAEDLARRVSRKMTATAYGKLPRDNDGRPILPSLTYRAWRAITG